MKDRIKIILKLNKINLIKRKKFLIIELLIMLLYTVAEIVSAINVTGETFGYVPFINVGSSWVVSLGLMILICIAAYKTYGDERQSLYAGGKVEYVAGRMVTDYINIIYIVLLQSVVYIIEALVLRANSTINEYYDTYTMFSFNYLVVGIVQSILLGFVIYSIYTALYSVFQRWYIPSIIAFAVFFVISSWLDTFSSYQLSNDTGWVFVKLYFSDVPLVAFVAIALITTALFSTFGCFMAYKQKGFRSHDYSFVSSIIVTGFVMIFLLMESYFELTEINFGDSSYSENAYHEGMIMNCFEIDITDREAFENFSQKRELNYYGVNYECKNMPPIHGSVVTAPIMYAFNDYFASFTKEEAIAAGLSFDESKVDKNHAVLVYGYQPREFCGKDIDGRLFEGLDNKLEFRAGKRNEYQLNQAITSTGYMFIDSKLVKNDMFIKPYMFNFGFGCADRFLNENHSIAGSSYRLNEECYAAYNPLIAYYLIYEK